MMLFFIKSAAAIADRVACGTEGTGADFFFVNNFLENPSCSRFGVVATI